MLEYYNRFSRKSSNKLAMMDIFWRDWYATSPYLYELGTPAKVYQCSNCGTIGMNF